MLKKSITYIYQFISTRLIMIVIGIGIIIFGIISPNRAFNNLLGIMIGDDYRKIHKHRGT